MGWAGEVVNLSCKMCFFFFLAVMGLELCLPASLLVACCGVGGRSLAVEEKALSEGVGKRSYAVALVGMGHDRTNILGCKTLLYS
jgi:hypothetical protein